MPFWAMQSSLEFPGNGLKREFPGIGGPDPLSGGPGPVIRESGVLDQESGGWIRESGVRTARKRGSGVKKILNWDPPPRNCPIREPRSQEQKKNKIRPQKKVIPQKKQTGPLYKPPPAYNIRSQLRVKRKYRSDSQGSKWTG
jgi:hypothetical protein